MKDVRFHEWWMEILLWNVYLNANAIQDWRWCAAGDAFCVRQICISTCLPHTSYSIIITAKNALVLYFDRRRSESASVTNFHGECVWAIMSRENSSQVKTGINVRNIECWVVVCHMIQFVFSLMLKNYHSNQYRLLEISQAYSFSRTVCGCKRSVWWNSMDKV